MSAFIRNNLGKLALSGTLVLILVIGLMLFGSFNSSKTLSSAIVEGGTGNYPYWSTPCIYAPFATSGKGYWCSGYNWGTKHNDSGNASVNSPYGYGYRNCTDYVAWKLNSLGVSQTLYQGLGNAKDWGTKASKKGVTVNSSPAVGAVAVDTIGQYGHVAFVESVNKNGTITVSQYNKGQDGNYSTQTGTPSSLNFSAFIHLERYETNHNKRKPAFKSTD
jgi:surface antigen